MCTRLSWICLATTTCPPSIFDCQFRHLPLRIHRWHHRLHGLLVRRIRLTSCRRAKRLGCSRARARGQRRKHDRRASFVGRNQHRASCADVAQQLSSRINERVTAVPICTISLFCLLCCAMVKCRILIRLPRLRPCRQGRRHSINSAATLSLFDLCPQEALIGNKW